MSALAGLWWLGGGGTLVLGTSGTSTSRNINKPEEHTINPGTARGTIDPGNKRYKIKTTHPSSIINAIYSDMQIVSNNPPFGAGGVSGKSGSNHLTYLFPI